MLVENAIPTAQSPSRQGRNVKIVDFNVQSLRDLGYVVGSLPEAKATG
jgi:hypothetical protein